LRTWSPPADLVVFSGARPFGPQATGILRPAHLIGAANAMLT
jgi:hypothetical protein